MNADVGPQCPDEMSPIARRISWQFEVAPYQERSEKKEEIACNIEGLTHVIPEYARMGDVPCQYQRHMLGASDSIRQLLTYVVRAVTCYHKHHAV